MVSKELVIGVAVVLAAFAIMSVNKTEGWRPFAWYGYPGTKKGTLGYQARGDWCGVDPATRRVDKPLPLIAPRRSMLN
jgi:hypothetical protein